MNELQVVVQSTPAKLRWNFEELKLALAAEMQRYEGMIYTEDTLPTAKADVAELRKLRKQVEDRRKEIKQLCMEPYTVIEAQAKELTALIDSPIELIVKQINEYEERQLEERRAAIRAYMEQVFSELLAEHPGDGEYADIVQTALNRSFDPAWAKKSTSRKVWQKAVDDLVASVRNDLDAVIALDKDFSREALREYARTMSVSAAVRRVGELRELREKILAEERKRQETAATPAQAVPEKEPAPSPAAPPAVEHVAQMQAGPKEVEEITEKMKAAAATVVAGKFPERGEPGAGTCLRVFGTPEQVKKILGYIQFVGARYIVEGM